MDIKNKEPIQAALDSLEMALENLEDKEEYTLNDVSIKDLWDIWEEASHQLGMSDDKEELKHFADGFHEGEWERDVEVPRPRPGLNQILKDMNIPDEWKSVKTMTYDEFTKKYGNIKTEMTNSGTTTYTPEWIYESPDGGKTIYRRKSGDDERELVKGEREMSGKRGTYFEIEQLERRVEKLELILEKFMEQWGPDVQKKRDERDRRWDEMVRVLRYKNERKEKKI